MVMIMERRSRIAYTWGKRPKIGSLVQNMVPFQRLDEEALLHIMQARLESLVDVYGQRSGLKRVCFSHQVIKALVDNVLSQHPHTNARGVELVLDPKVVEPLLVHIELLDRKARAKAEQIQKANKKAAPEEKESYARLMKYLFGAAPPEWHGEFEASLYFSKGDPSTTRALVMEIKELQTGEVIRKPTSWFEVRTNASSIALDEIEHSFV